MPPLLSRTVALVCYAGGTLAALLGRTDSATLLMVLGFISSYNADRREDRGS